MTQTVSEALDDDRDSLITQRVDKLGNPLPPWRTPSDDPRFELSVFDYADPAGLFGCGYCARPLYADQLHAPLTDVHSQPYLGCGGQEAHDWIEWLRDQEVYPLPGLGRPVL